MCLLGKFPCLVEDKVMEKIGKTMKEAMQQEIEQCEKAFKKETMTAILLHGANKVRYGKPKSTLAQNISMGMNQYPWTTEETLNILNTYSQTMRFKKKDKPQDKDNA